MNKNAKEAAELYALGMISAEQVEEFTNSTQELEEAMQYAEKYSREYSEYLKGLEVADKYKLTDEYNYCVFELGMTPEEALLEWDI
mgnify:CR=1 FL=1|jgi:hypothetical protein